MHPNIQPKKVSTCKVFASNVFLIVKINFGKTQVLEKKKLYPSNVGDSSDR